MDCMPPDWGTTESSVSEQVYMKPFFAQQLQNTALMHNLWIGKGNGNDGEAIE